MWNRLLSWVEQLLNLTREVNGQAADLAKTRDELDKLTTTVRQLAYDLQTLRAECAHERENLELRLQVQLLHFERRLSPPTGNPSEQPKLE